MDLEDLRTRLGCGCLGILFVMAPFVYLWVASGGGSPFEPERKEPAAGTADHVEFLLGSKKDPDAALAECRELLAASPEQRAELEPLLRRSLGEAFDARKATQDWKGAEAFRDELRRDFAGSPEADRVDREWLMALGKYAEAALAGGDLDLAAGIAAKILAQPRWRPIRWDDPLFEVLSKLWRRAMARGDVAGAGRILEEPLADPRFQQGSLRLQKEHREWLEQAFTMAWASGDREEADRLFGRILEPNQAVPRVDLAAYRDYLSDRLRALASSGRFDEADAFFDRLSERAEGGTQTREALLRPLYTIVHEGRWRGALESGDLAAAEAEIEGGGRYPYMIDPREGPRQEVEYRLLRWRREREAGSPEANRQLETILARLARYADPATISAALHEAWTPEEILSRGDAFLTKGDEDAALACFEALAGSNMAGLDDRLDRCRLESARTAARAGSQWVDFASFARAEALYEGLLHERPSFAADPARWRAAAESLLDVQLEWARKAADADLPIPAGEALERALRRTAVSIWRHDASAAGADPFEGVPDEVRERVEKTVPGAGPAEVVAALADLAARGKWVVPAAARAREVAARVEEAAALGQVEDASLHLHWAEPHRGRSLETLRAVARKHRGTRAAARVKEVLEESAHREESTVHLYATAGDMTDENAVLGFGRLCEILAFYVAEVGPPATDDPFREELRRSLTEAADLAGRGSRMARAFLLSLLADALPDDEAGRRAREEALRIGLDVMATLPASGEARAANEFPSTLAGRSVIALENQMPYHLLVFLKGPETFYARLDPYSRGSIVLADGTYESAVIVPTGEVRPYRGGREYRGVVTAEAYVIESPGGDRKFDPRELTDDFELLRAPAGGRFWVHPESGLVLEAGG